MDLPDTAEVCAKFGSHTRELKNGEVCCDFYMPSDQQSIIQWKTKPQNVLILGKYFDPEVRQAIEDISRWLSIEKHLNVIVSAELELEGYLKHDEVDLDRKIDFIVTIGGDGALLYVNTLFPNRVPPVIPFRLGSLAFLSIFDVNNYKEVIEYVIQGKFNVLSRMRLELQIQRAGADKLETEIKNVLNEVVVKNGITGSVCTLDTYCNGDLITTVTGDGIIIGTSTGSTAYNLAAGGSMVHPNVSTITFTPICPHSLSFRPVILPPSVELKVTVAPDARNSAWALFDGRGDTELHKGDSIIGKMSSHPFLTVCDPNETNGWFSALARTLNWNVRERQKIIIEKR